MSLLTASRSLIRPVSIVRTATAVGASQPLFIPAVRHATHDTRIHVILLQDIPHIGLKHEIKAVRKG